MGMFEEPIVRSESPRFTFYRLSTPRPRSDAVGCRVLCLLLHTVLHTFLHTVHAAGAGREFGAVIGAKLGAERNG